MHFDRNAIAYGSRLGLKYSDVFIFFSYAYVVRTHTIFGKIDLDPHNAYV